MRRLLLTVLAAASLVSCASPLPKGGQWARRDTTAEEFRADWNACEGDELKGPDGVVVPIIALPVVEGILFGIQHAKAKGVRRCLEERGYRLIEPTPAAMQCADGQSLVRAYNGEAFCR